MNHPKTGGHLLCFLYNWHCPETYIWALTLVISGPQNISHIEVIHEIKSCSQTRENTRFLRYLWTQYPVHSHKHTHTQNNIGL